MSLCFPRSSSDSVVGLDIVSSSNKNTPIIEILFNRLNLVMIRIQKSAKKCMPETQNSIWSRLLNKPKQINLKRMLRS